MNYRAQVLYQTRLKASRPRSRRKGVEFNQYYAPTDKSRIPRSFVLDKGFVSDGLGRIRCGW